MAINNAINSQQDLSPTSSPTFASLDVPENFTLSTTITSSSTIPAVRLKIAANEAINVGDLLKCSTSVDFRVEQIKTSDSPNVPLVGTAITSAAMAGDVIEVIGMTVFPVILNETLVVGDYIEKSSSVDGRVAGSTPNNSFAQMLEGGVAGEVRLAVAKMTFA